VLVRMCRRYFRLIAGRYAEKWLLITKWQELRMHCF